jgi:hypothetical protein
MNTNGRLTLPSERHVSRSFKCTGCAYSYLAEVDAGLVVPLIPEAGGVTPDVAARPGFVEGSGINEQA